MSPPVHQRHLPAIPDKAARIPLLIDTDAGCELDDQYAIALALLMPERFEVKGFVATFFRGSPESIPEAQAEIKTIMHLCGAADACPVVPGGAPLAYATRGNQSSGAEFIIETALRHTPDKPLWITVLGPATNTASALIQCPEIADRIAVLFHGRTQFWPLKAWNNNVNADLRATTALFQSAAPLILFDTGTHLKVENSITRKFLAVRGPIGAYLQDLREARPDPRTTHNKAFSDLGDIAWLADPGLGEAEEIQIPELQDDTVLNWNKTFGPAFRVYQITNAAVWELLFSTLETIYPKPSKYTPQPDQVILYPEKAAAAAAKKCPKTSQPERRIPELPADGDRIPLLIDTDVGTELDDQYAIAMALACPDRFDIRAITCSHIHKEPGSPDVSVTEARKLLDLAGMPAICPIAKGSDPMTWPGVPSDSAAVEQIIETASAFSREDPLWIVALGPLTNIASAWLKAPEISDKMVLVFHSRCRHWDLKFSSYNARQDLRAARVIFRSDIPLILFDAGTYLSMKMQETEEYVAPMGKIGEYLHSLRFRHPFFQTEKKGFFDLGDFVWLYDLSIGEYREIRLPGFDTDLYLDPSQDHGRCLRVHQIDNQRARNLFYQKMAFFATGAAQ